MIQILVLIVLTLLYILLFVFSLKYVEDAIFTQPAEVENPA